MTERYETLDGGRLTVHRDFAGLLRRRGLDVFENYYDQRAGELLRDVGRRANLRVTFEAEGGALTGFLKRHEPLSLTERLKAWLRLRRAKTAARTEWENIERLAGLGISTMPPIALGEDRATGRSFLLTAEIGSATPADDYAREHFTSNGGPALEERRKFVRGLAELVRTLHAAGLTHRDLYLCHVFVRKTGGDFRLHLIDLQRVEPSVLRRRWRVKDVAQLEYSRPAGTFTTTDAVRFLHGYFDTRRLDHGQKIFARDVLGKAARMRRRNQAKRRPR
jgi:heptose I phosphotransferase